MKILIFDEDKAFVEKMLAAISTYFCKIGETCSCVSISSIDILLSIDVSKYHVAFIGIDISALNGIDIAYLIHERAPKTLEILMSEDTRQAPAGYTFNAFRYLIKGHMEYDLYIYLEEIEKKLLSEHGLVKIKAKDGLQKFRLKDIVYIEGSANRKVYIHTVSSEIIEGYGKIASLDDELQNQGFLRIQRGYIVNLQHVTEIKNYYAFLKNGEALKTSVQNYSLICKKYLSWKNSQHKE